MSDPARALISRKQAEIALSLVTGAIGVAVIVGARDLETGWGSSGPEAGYFPFRIGIIITAASALVLSREFLRGDATTFIAVPQAKRLALFAAPLVGLVALTPFIGVYLAAAVYLLVAIGLVGRVTWAKTLAIALVAPTLLFIAFEWIFRVPLPKGPIAGLFGIP